MHVVLRFPAKRLESELIISLLEFDVILGMDCLNKYDTHVDCSMKKVTLCLDDIKFILWY